MSLFNISGISSGFDWGNILDQLMQIERQPVVKLQQQQQKFQSKIKVWQTVNSQLASLSDTADALRGADAFNLFSSSLSSSSSTDAENILRTTIDENASQGSYEIVVNQTARKQKISSGSISDSTSALGISGDILINGITVSVTSSDSLNDIKDAVNNANTGENPTNVSASIIETSSSDYRLILTSDESGADGLSLLEGGTGNVLQSLGMVSSNLNLQYQTSDGAQSGAFSDTTSAIGDALGLNSPQSGTVTIGGQNISIDLATDSLSDIANTIDGTAGLSASIVTEVAENGEPVYRIDVSGSTSFSDTNNILQTLGFLSNSYADVQEVHTSDISLSQTTAAGGGSVTAATLFSEINTGGDSNNITNGDTITISGLDHNGNEVSGSYTISDVNVDTIGDFLNEIENTFGGSEVIEARISDGSDGYTSGSIVIQDLQGGDSVLNVSVTSNNEGGGSLNFGTMNAAIEGYSMEAQAGRDASLTVDGVTISRSSNAIDNIIEGVTFDLMSADAGTTVTLDISRDEEGLKELVNNFVNSYNSIATTINKHFSYSEDSGAGGILFGDGTLRSVQSDLRNVITSQMENLGQYSTLASIGVHIDKTGLLLVNDDELTSALSIDPASVQQVFSGLGTVDSNNLEYVRHTNATEPGTYEVNITQTAAKASVTGSADLSGGLTASQSISVTTGTSTASLTFNAGSTIDTIVAVLNSEFDSSYKHVVTEASGHTDSSTGNGITAGSTWNNIDAGDVSNGETITINGTDRNGGAISSSYTISDITSNTVGDLLDEIENAFGNTVTATVTSNGQIQVQDNRTGESSLTLSLTYSGGGSLTFDTMDETTTGRHSMLMTASKTANNELILTHDRYGSESFTVTADGEFGITDGTYSGQDVAGTINGESATGSGQSLKADEGTIAEGLRINYTGSSTGVIGNVMVSFGVAESMYQRLEGLIDPYDGYVSNKIDSLQDRVRNFSKLIEKKEDQIELKRQHLFNKFISMEMSISRLQAESNWLNNQLSGLTQFL